MIDDFLSVLLSGVQGGGEALMKQKEQQKQTALEEEKRRQAFRDDILKSVLSNVYRPKSPFELNGPIDFNDPKSILGSIKKAKPSGGGGSRRPFGMPRPLPQPSGGTVIDLSKFTK